MDDCSSDTHTHTQIIVMNNSGLLVHRLIKYKYLLCTLILVATKFSNEICVLILFCIHYI